MDITPEWASEHFSYDPTEPLAIRWRKLPPKTSRLAVGDIAGHWHPAHAGSPNIRRYVARGNSRLSVTKIVWALCKNEVAPLHVHFVTDNGDYRIENLTLEKPKWF